MADLRSVVDHIHRHPGMYFGRSDPSDAECAVHLLGWDTATDGVALSGFRGWLVARVVPRRAGRDSLK